MRPHRPVRLRARRPEEHVRIFLISAQFLSFFSCCYRKSQKASQQFLLPCYPLVHCGFDVSCMCIAYLNKAVISNPHLYSHALYASIHAYSSIGNVRRPSKRANCIFLDTGVRNRCQFMHTVDWRRLQKRLRFTRDSHLWKENSPLEVMA